MRPHLFFLVSALFGMLALACDEPAEVVDPPAESPLPHPTRSVPPPAPLPPASAVEPPAGSADAGAVTALYFPSREYVKSGDETLPQLVPERRRLPTDTPASTEERAKAALRALAEGPRSRAGTETFPKGVRIQEVQLKGTTVIVDFARVGLAGGSLQERLMVRALVRTLTELNGIDQVQFHVDGQHVETLMGHLDVSQPLTASDLEQ